MKRIMAALMLTTMSWMTAVAPVKGAGQPVKDDMIMEKAKTYSRDEKLMPEPEVQLKRLAAGLQLTEGQQNQIKPLLDGEYVKMKEIRQNDEISPKQIQKMIEKLRAETIEKIQAYLTPEQQAKYALVNTEIKANKQKRMKENRKTRIGTKAEPPEAPRQ